MLGLVFLLNFVNIFLILITPRENISRLWKMALQGSLLTLTATILLWASFDGEGLFQEIKKFE